MILGVRPCLTEYANEKIAREGEFRVRPCLQEYDDGGSDSVPPVVTYKGVNQHFGTLCVKKTVRESYQRAGVGSFQSDDGLTGQILGNGNTRFNVGLTRNSFVGAGGQWLLDLLSLSSEFLSYPLSDVVTTRIWSEANEPYTSFHGTDTTHDMTDETRTSESTHVTSAAGVTTGCMHFIF